MRYVFDHREEARAKGKRGAADIRRTHSARKAGEAMRDRLAHVAPCAPGSECSASITQLASRVAAGPLDRTRRRPPRRILRGLVLRAMKPFTAFQTNVNAETVDVMRELAQELETVRAEQLRVETRRLREAREELRLAPPAERTSPPALDRIGELSAVVERRPSDDVVSELLVVRKLPDGETAIGDTNGHGEVASVT
jgi:hypothetical protein